MADTLVTREGAVNRGFARVSWGAIFAGAVATIAFGLLLHSLGAAIGLTAFDPGRGLFSSTGGVVSGIWSMLSIVVATFFGAYLASRCSGVDAKYEGGFQGIFIWALSLLAMLAWTSTTAIQAAAQAAAAQGLPGGVELGRAGEVGAITAWWFFLTAAVAAAAGYLGGTAGLPKSLKQPLEVRRRDLTPTETRV